MAIEPSEILDARGVHREKVSHVHPQIRLLARFFDYSLFLLLILTIRLLSNKFPTHLFEYMIPLEFFAWIPLEALLLSTWGTTPGKFLLRTTLHQGRKQRLDFLTAMRRSFLVWFRGIGMGIPGVNILCMMVAGHKLRLLGMTSWDREVNITITHRPVSTGRLFIATTVIFLGFFGYYGAKKFYGG
jgi:hypothetical protein